MENTWTKIFGISLEEGQSIEDEQDKKLEDNVDALIDYFNQSKYAPIEN